MEYLVKDRTSIYKIILPQNATNEIEFAANEINYALKECCGCELPIICEESELAEKGIYLGGTKKTLEKFDVLSLDKYSGDGFVVDIINGDVYIRSAGREGIIYGVYQFLNKVLGCEFFGYGAYELPKQEDVVLEDQCFSAVPDIETRVRGLEWKHYDTTTERRLGFNTGNGRTWVTWAHTYFQLVPKDKYYETHRDYYSPDGLQLCLTHPDIVDVVAKNAIARLTDEVFDKSDMLFLMVGQEDGYSFCDCDRCKQAEKKYGKSGIMMRFTNAVADIVNDYVEKNHPNKVVKTITFAYALTMDAPVKEENGLLKPLDDSVIAHKNVGIMYAPLESNWAYSLLDEKNNPQMSKALKGWKTINGELFVWTYDGIFDDCFYFLDNWNWWAEHYRTFKDCGACYIFDQGYPLVNLPFTQLRNYVRGKLMWDLSLDAEILIKRFIKAYYKEASKTVGDFFYSLRRYYEKKQAEFEAEGKQYASRAGANIMPFIREADFWDKDFLEKSIEKMEECRKHLTDNDDFHGALNRLEVEMLTPIYVLMEMHGQTLSPEQIDYYIHFFERVSSRNGIYAYSEWGGQIIEKLYNWAAYLEV